jgi:ubiquitin C-terminal hydrolase
MSINENDIEISLITEERKENGIISESITTTKKQDKQNNPYSGLVNQGRTCYMNSLLQSLYMTPEFRRKILTWGYDPANHGPKNDSIPFQLKKLFARLHLRQFDSERTKDLTKSIMKH